MGMRTRVGGSAKETFAHSASEGRKRSLYLCSVALLTMLLSPALAEADGVRVSVRNAPPGAEVAARVSGPEVSASDAGVADEGGDLSLLLEMGSLGKAAPVQVDVYLDDCGDQATVHLVAAGGDDPDCDDAGDDDCRCRRVGAFLMKGDTSVVRIDWQTGAVTAQGSKTGFRVGLGVDFVDFGGDDPPLDPALMRDLRTDDSDTGFSLFAEYAFLPWLAVGLGYEDLGKIGLDGVLTAEGFPEFQLLSRGEIDPESAEIYLLFSRWLSARLALSFMAGAAYWEAESTSMEVVTENGSPVESFSNRAENDGWSPLLGVALDYWIRDWIGIRVAYKWLELSQSYDEASQRPELERTAQALRLLLTFGF